MRSLLVTGGAGFIGANFVHYWLKRHAGDRLVVLDALTYAGNIANLEATRDKPGFHFVVGDIRDEALLDALLAEHAIDTVVHFAAESHVDRSIAGPDAFIETNILGTHALLKAAKRAWLDSGCAPPSARFHYVSTDEVYGSLDPSDPAFSEATPYTPNSPYAASKAAADHLVRAYHHTFELPVTTSNCSNNYGQHQFPEKLIPLMIIHALEGKALPIYGDGRNIRDWLHVADHCRGIELVLERGKTGRTYNLGGNNEQANIAIVRLLCRLIDETVGDDSALQQRFPSCPAASGKPTDSLIRFVTDRPGHDRRYAINTERARNELGYVPQVEFAEGLRETLAWYLANEPWWRNILSGAYRDWMHQQYGM